MHRTRPEAPSNPYLSPVQRRQFVQPPVFRKLRVFAVDPGLNARFETAVLNEVTLQIPWEDLKPGPSGEYIHVVDEDDKGNQLYEPLDLNRPDVLARNGLTPSDGDPFFHQQMVYAVAMRTIRIFEQALGRLTHWFQKPVDDHPRNVEYQPQLKFAPHFNCDSNAHYDRDAGLLHFGYFVSDIPVPNSQVFTCLSQDIIARELTHALLAGMHIQFDSNDLNPDSAAFSEAFADLIPLLLHFWKSDAFVAQIAEVRGRLDLNSPLGAIALQIGQALGKPEGIRNALGSTDDQGVWHPRQPDPKSYMTETEKRARSDILVGAVFAAFKKIYDSRVADLMRLASKGTGILADGNLHPDMVNRLAAEATWSAELVLDMCIRALDYLPPVGATFGDFLRAVITADFDLEPSDVHHYRVAFVEGFRRFGIAPPEVGTLSVDTLLYSTPADSIQAKALLGFVGTLAHAVPYWILPKDRKEIWYLLEEKKRDLKCYLTETHGLPKTLGPVDLDKPFEIQSLHPRERAGSDGNVSSQWVIKLVQPAFKARASASNADVLIGCTLLVDADTGMIRYQIAKAPSPPRRTRKAKNTAPTILPVAQTGNPPSPDERFLRVFAFDPSIGVQFDTAVINEVTLRVPWEKGPNGHDLIGPVGEYLEVVDRDPASRGFYAPVNLDDPHLLAQDGLTPSESNPQFHQQMVYAVAMRTIRTFEKALGRLVLWSPRPAVPPTVPGGTWQRQQYVQRLRVYPHALREANAYYSPTKKALLFGYFPASDVSGDGLSTPITVFTCLSHDIVAHETSHALLDGMHRRFDEPSNPDVLAFHEAFADIVAIFQHFSLPDVLKQQVGKTRGDLESQNQLGELAQQFGQATGKRGALRSALGGIDPETDKWVRAKPDPDALAILKEPHDRGAILVAAVFDAFLTIYKASVADLLRIATEGTGVLPQGQVHPDLVNRMAEEAAEAAEDILNMCIRALDYCPPVDLTFGDYLRALVTADFEYDPVDERLRRVAVAEAFRRHGIVPEDVRTLSVDGLLWRSKTGPPEEDENLLFFIVQKWASDIASWNLTGGREALFNLMRDKQAVLHGYLTNRVKKNAPLLSAIDPAHPIEVHSIRPSLRIDREGKPWYQWIIELTQRISQYADQDEQTQKDRGPDYYFRGGCTLVVDAVTGTIRYSIKKRLNEVRRLKQRRNLLEEENESLSATYFGTVGQAQSEPFAMLHRF